MADVTTTSAPTLEEVELQGGIKTMLPADAAAKYREARTKDKAERETLARDAGAAKAEKDAAALARQKAEQDKEAVALAAKGEVDKVRELLTKETTEKVDRLAARYRDTHLRAALGAQPNLLKLADSKAQQSLVDDLVAGLRASCRFDVESDMLVVIGADGRPALGHDGRPMQVDAWIAQHIDARPYLRNPTSAPGSGAAGGTKTTTGPVVTQQALDAMRPRDRAKHFESGGSVQG